MSAEGRTVLLRRLLGAAVVVILLGGAAWIAHAWLTTPPRAERRRPARRATLVRVDAVRFEDFAVRVNVMGTVAPDRTVRPAARVGGELIDVNPSLVVGGHVAEKDVLVALDPRDFDLALETRAAEIARQTAERDRLRHQATERAADVVRTESDLRLERARQTLAAEEAKLLGDVIEEADREFVLRRPQLASAEAAVTAAKASAEAAAAALRSAESVLEVARTAKQAAQLDVERTIVRAPFNAVVLEESVEVGSQVSPGGSLALLAGTDVYRIELAVPVDQLRWIRFPAPAGGEGSRVTIHDEAAWGVGASRVGRVARLGAELQPSGRMAMVVVLVDDPLSLKPENAGEPRLLLGAYVRAEIAGVTIPRTVVLPNAVLRDGDHLWLRTADGRLEIRAATIAWRGRDVFCVSDGLKEGEQVIVSELTAPVEGMLVRLPGEPVDAGAEDGRTEP